MNPEIIGAIIGAAAMLVAAIIKPWKPKKRNAKLPTGFLFGYYTMELYYAIKFRYEAELILTDDNFKNVWDVLIVEDRIKCQNLAKELKITFIAKSIVNNNLSNDQPIYISEIDTAIVALPTDIKHCIRSASLLSSIFHRDYQFNFLNLTGFSFPKEQIEFVKNELDGEMKRAKEEFKKANLKVKVLNELINYINGLRSAPYISKTDFADSFSNVRKLVEKTALKIK